MPSYAKVWLTFASAPIALRLVAVRTNRRQCSFLRHRSPCFTKRQDSLDPSLRYRLASDSSCRSLTGERSDRRQDQSVRERDDNDDTGGGGGGETCCVWIRIRIDCTRARARTGGEWNQHQQGEREGGRCVRGVAAPVCGTKEEIESRFVLYSPTLQNDIWRELSDGRVKVQALLHIPSTRTRTGWSMYGRGEHSLWRTCLAHALVTN